jgi:molecular chaperone DnaK (HSP70)
MWPKTPVFPNFKRGIGAAIQGFLPDIDGQQLSFEQLGQWFLTEVIAAAKAQAPETDTLVLTVPVDSFETYRNWLGQVCESLAIQQVRLLDEPTAAALGYGIQGQETLLVVDFGGGTLDLSLVQLTTQSPAAALRLHPQVGAKVHGPILRAAASDRSGVGEGGENLGGADLDNWLADYFRDQQGLPISPLTLRWWSASRFSFLAKTALRKRISMIKPWKAGS